MVRFRDLSVRTLLPYVLLYYRVKKLQTGHTRYTAALRKVSQAAKADCNIWSIENIWSKECLYEAGYTAVRVPHERYSSSPEYHAWYHTFKGFDRSMLRVIMVLIVLMVLSTK